MLLRLDPHSGVPIYRQVIEQIRRQVMTGQLAPGEQLESVKALSSRLKVNPMTISKAYSFLAEEGLLERRRGIGLFVNRVPSAQREREQRRILRRALETAALLAVQFGVSAQSASELLGELHAEMAKSKEGR